MGRVFKAWLVLIALLLMSAPSQSQSYPTRPVRVLVPFPPGGVSDTYARSIAVELERLLGQPFIVENATSSGANFGHKAANSLSVARAAPDGYTLLVVTNTQTTVESLTYDTQFRLLRDLRPVASINYSDLAMVVNSSLQVNSVADFINLAKSSSRRLTYASSGPGSPHHMAGEQFRLSSGIDLVHVPYRSATSARNDLLAGQVHMMFDTVPAVFRLIQAGRLRALGTSGPRRVESLPDVPSLRESGLPGFDLVLWTGLAAPAGTPQEIIERLNSAIGTILDRPSLRNEWERLGVTPWKTTPSEFSDFVRRDIEKWGDLARRTGTRLD